ncbi:hypothetical protein DACRYDRAFT_119030 [Dacryopinax primogenitus]|uniref:F-box domain-containing protein n=1 Tax=Dacryopinax primogenitus (strain DJM 731) TaxID=1858805 RepID=M5FQK6_DACPD|nr:uncharacterized protein DACRYDRAFT_119030 [Dacryopinax primogenitus]EJT97798.1 hypothetical protein DACRYDRAFT_119030 [Dacryopinax primogenitus]
MGYLPPICRLPTELLALIFATIVQEYESDPPYPEALGWFLLSVTLVSYPWREIALGTPRLWRNILIPGYANLLDRSQGGESAWELVGRKYHSPAFCIRQSAVVPLFVYVDGDTWPQELIDSLLRPGICDRIQKHYLGPLAISSVTPHNFRSLRSLGISIQHFRTLELIYSWLLACGPSLFRLEFDSTLYCPTEPEALIAIPDLKPAELHNLKELCFWLVRPVDMPHILSCISAPHLEHLTLLLSRMKDWPSSERCIPPACLTSFGASGSTPLHELKQLTLGGRLTARDVHAVLSLASTLEELRLVDFQPPREETQFVLLSLAASESNTASISQTNASIPLISSSAPLLNSESTQPTFCSAPLRLLHLTTLALTRCKISLSELLRLLDYPLASAVRTMLLDRHKLIGYKLIGHELSELAALREAGISVWLWWHGPARFMFERRETVSLWE